MKALIMIGSPRKGASWKLGKAMAEHLTAQGIETDSIQLIKNLGDTWPELEAAVNEADLLILSIPLYVDTLPALTMSALTGLKDKVTGKGLAVLINCGFPEPHHNDTALEVCRQFALEARCTWLGGMALSMGGFSFGKGVSRRVNRAFRLAATAIGQGKGIPEASISLTAKTPMSKWLYLLILNKTFRTVNRKHGKAPIDAKPYRQ